MNVTRRPNREISVFLGVSRRIPGQHIRVHHDRLLPNPSPLTTRYYLPISFDALELKQHR